MITKKGLAHYSIGDRIFLTFNWIFLILVFFILLYPLLFIVSASFSSGTTVMGLTLLPRKFSLAGYKAVFEYKDIWTGYGNSLLYMTLWAVLGPNSEYFILYRIPFLEPEYANELGQTVFFIRESSIEKLFSPIFSTGASNVWIIGNNGLVLSSLAKDNGIVKHSGENLPHGFYEELKEKGNPRTLEFSGFVMTQHNAGDHGITVISAVPMGVYYQQANDVLKVVILIIAVLLLVGIIVSGFLYYYNQRPLRRIVNQIPEIDPSLSELRQNSAVQSGLWVIDRALTQIYRKNKELERNMEVKSQLLQKMVVSKLLSDEPITEDEAANLLSSFNVSYTKGKTLFRGVYVRCFSTGQHPVISYDILQNAIQSLEESGQFVFVGMYGPDVFAILEIIQPDIPESDKHNKDKMISYYKMYGSVKKDLGISLLFYLGLPQLKLQSIQESFSQARHMMLSEETQEGKFVLEYNEKPFEDASLFYSPLQEEKLLNLISAGDEQAVEQFLGKIFREHFTIRKINPLIKKILYYRLLETIIRAGYQFSSSDDKIFYHASSVPEIEFFDFIKDVCLTLCLEAKERIRNKRSQLYQELLDYLQENFADSSLSLASLSMQFHMTESYLSTFIKEQFGETFSTYIELLRINKANMLLEKGKLSVNEIAKAVGYTSSNSFGRAYKRVMGFSPSSFKRKTVNVSHGMLLYNKKDDF